MAVALTPFGQQPPAGLALRSILVVECGSVWTHAALFGMAEGHCRLIARADANSTETYDIGAGALAAVGTLEQITGRRLLRQGQALTPETETGDGVDGVAIVTSAGGPLELFITGPGIELRSNVVRRALSTVSATPRLATNLAPELYPLLQAESATQLPPEGPHAIVILGAGADALANPTSRAEFEEAITTAIAMTSTRESAMLLLGTPEEEQAAQPLLGGRSLTLVDPTKSSTLATALSRAYETQVIEPIPGFSALRGWTTSTPISAKTALGRFVRFLAQRYATNVLTVSVGAHETLAVGASAQGNLFTTQAARFGVRQGAGNVARRAGWDALARWLANEQTETALREAVLHRMTHPTLLPITPEELELDHALAREALRLVMDKGETPGGVGDLPRIDVIFGTGSLIASAPDPGMATLLLLDAIQPRGVTSLVLDIGQMAFALGAASMLDPLAAADAVDMDALLMQLGTCVSTVGTPAPGEPAVRVSLEYADGRRHAAEVLHGTIELLPLGVGQRARLLLEPASTVDIGLGPGERAHANEPIEGGRLGVIIDARGRPLDLSVDAQQRQARLRQWRAALGF